LITAEGGGNEFVVNFTNEGAMGSTMIVSDKYSAEVAEAYLAGKSIRAKLVLKEYPTKVFVSDRFYYESNPYPQFRFLFTAPDSSNSLRDIDLYVNLSTSASITFWGKNPCQYWRDESVLDMTGWIFVDTALAKGGNYITEQFANCSAVQALLNKRPVKMRITVNSNNGITLETNVIAQAIYAGENLMQHQINAFAYDDAYGLIYLFAIFGNGQLKYKAKVVSTTNLG
jgi:hypothetical protein